MLHEPGTERQYWALVVKLAMPQDDRRWGLWPEVLNLVDDANAAVPAAIPLYYTDGAGTDEWQAVLTTYERAYAMANYLHAHAPLLVRVTYGIGFGTILFLSEREDTGDQIMDGPAWWEARDNILRMQGLTPSYSKK